MRKACSQDECKMPVAAGGMCQRHYTAAFKRGWRTGGRQAPPCEIEECDRPVRSRGMCERHYNKWRRRNNARATYEPQAAPRKDAKGGYVYVLAKDSPMAGAKGYVLEHRLVMAEALGRPLLRGENVHHLNGDRRDNRLENLELWNTVQPAGQRIPDKVQWAIDILRLYSPESLSSESDAAVSNLPDALRSGD